MAGRQILQRDGFNIALSMHKLASHWHTEIRDKSWQPPIMKIFFMAFQEIIN